MVTYIYFVKCPNCEDEYFDFFDEAKEFALGCLSKKPVITQTEVCRNDFGECTDSADLGTVWSWEDMMGEGGYTDAEPTKSIFTKDDLKLMADGQDLEFDSLDNSVDYKAEEPILDEWVTNSEQETAKQYIIKVSNDSDGYNYEGNGGRSLVRIDSDALSIFSSLADAEASLAGYKKGSKAKIVELADELRRKPIPEGMTIEQLVEEMEENEDTVECTWCEDLFDKSECRYEVDLGWLCSRCEMAIKSRGETLTFREGSYWDFLDEDLEELSFSEMVADSINHLINDLGKDSSAEDFADDVIADIENNYDTEVPEDPEKYRDWASAVACEVSRQLNNQPQLDEELETKTWICEFDGKEIGTVEAATEEEAYEAMEHKYYDYNYGLYDGVAMVYPADEDLTEASLSDILSNANTELGTSYDERGLLSSEGVEDADYFADIETYPELKAETNFRHRRAGKTAEVRAADKLEDLDPEELHDLGNEYDGGYPAESHLRLCPECGKETFDIETGICIECGFN